MSSQAQELMAAMCEIRSSLVAKGAEIPQGTPLSDWPAAIEAITQPDNWQLIAHGTTTGSTPIVLNTTGVNLLVATAFSYNAAFNPSDSQSNVWTQGVYARTGTTTSAISYSINPVVAASHSFTFAPNQYSGMAILGFRSLSAMSVDQSSSALNTTVSQLHLNPLTPSLPDSLVIAAVTVNYASTAAPSVMVDSGFISTGGTPATSAGRGGQAAYVVQHNLAAVAPTWTTSVSVNEIVGTMLSFFHF